MTRLLRTIVIVALIGFATGCGGATSTLPSNELEAQQKKSQLTADDAEREYQKSQSKTPGKK